MSITKSKYLEWSFQLEDSVQSTELKLHIIWSRTKNIMDITSDNLLKLEDAMMLVQNEDHEHMAAYGWAIKMSGWQALISSKDQQKWKWGNETSNLE